MIIDLSHRLDTDTPVYPGDPSLTITPQGSVATDGYLGHSLQLGTHLGTHIDAPAHMIEGARTLDSYDVARFVGPGKYIFAKDGAFTIAQLNEANVSSGDIVLLHTGMGVHFKKPEYFTNYPAITPDVAQYLADRQVALVGIDTCSIDNQSDFPNHKILLDADIPIIENLTNLEQLDGQTFRVFALPLRFNLDGAPARVVAELL